ncbi:MAG: carbamoyltransferase HypF [Mycobacteriaceae bacterium]|nr:carbamoyltransferase HypF [Mycobacteriaceae bacterium]
MTGRCRLRVDVRGVVQGVGFRPFVHSRAVALGLSGSVRNDDCGVIIEVEGDVTDLRQFLTQLLDQQPPLAVIESIAAVDIPLINDVGFRIGDTARAVGSATLVCPDVAICARCVDEHRDPANRRYRHAFINCTDCGPRFTIIAALPYDRARTSMARFAMCADCADEYADSTNRRFHAQPVCCPNCGPTLRYRDHGGRFIDGSAGVWAARELLRSGGVLAIKGIGGYHLACDATDERAVSELRRRKCRGDKPFAVMVPDTATAATIAIVDDDCVPVLASWRRPIVLMPRRPGAQIAAAVAPHIPDLGVMLAYTPLHLLIFGLPGDAPSPQKLVMTSGNRGGEPICYTDEMAVDRLCGLADGWLMHDRPILVPCDDSVVRVIDGVELPIRRSRGYAPLPVALPVPVSPSLAVGGDLKGTLAVADGKLAWLSQHIGDMDDLATWAVFGSVQQHLQELTGVAPEILVADANPRYHSTTWAHRYSGHRPVRLVQHHHAHVAAVMAEHGLDNAHKVVGFVFDGTGYGSDGAIWGGEVMLADYHGYQRLARLKYVPLAGGDTSVWRPYRMALAQLWAAGLRWDTDLAPTAACPPDERRVLAHQFETGVGCVPTSSMGRLFDAVSALIGVRQVVTYEAQAAIELEGLSRGVACGARKYLFDVGGDTGVGGSAPIIVDPAPLLMAIIDDLRAGISAQVIGARFHHAIAGLVVELAERVAVSATTVVLSGGVFQNVLLLQITRKNLQSKGFKVLTHRYVPPNDGGIALGQIMVGNAG